MSKNLTEKQEVIHEYQLKIIAALIEGCFDDEGGDNYISVSEMKESKTLSEFFHALANCVPVFFYTQFVDDKVNLLDFNHIANKLCFQFLNKK